MPATFESFGIKFLYPDNWTIAARGEDESEDGVTLDLPSGGFFSIEVDDEGLSNDELLDRVHDTLRAEYHEIEVEKDVKLDGAGDNEQTTELRFYYLDLLIISRLIVINRERETLVVQIQGESRDFEKNEQVFAAILQQIRA